MIKKLPVYLDPGRYEYDEDNDPTSIATCCSATTEGTASVSTQKASNLARKMPRQELAPAVVQILKELAVYPDPQTCQSQPVSKNSESNQPMVFGGQRIMEERVKNAQASVAAQKEQAGAWAALQSLTDPMALHAAITAQGAACGESTARGARLAAEIWELLKQRDEAFVDTLRTQVLHTPLAARELAGERGVLTFFGSLAVVTS